jgi:hypothetical protein
MKINININRSLGEAGGCGSKSPPCHVTLIQGQSSLSETLRQKMECEAKEDGNMGRWEDDVISIVDCIFHVQYVSLPKLNRMMIPLGNTSPTNASP